ncbi:hypothetical protein Q4583_02715 [Neptunomonas phycophila]|uniref:DoxX protein n=2 Tax=Neptunomonas phycophila TaxID=1572645 RepID=A0AAW7XG38_9GAMM|nr:MULTISPECIES: hypothetical protein [Neptunomonas]MDN2659505.1 hypothetical protein [Neptunomonas sp. CHC150]MDO6452047.1 hypothetical protein [Neptunomonas phycophila]MDO6466600.1 hypothetical protein [Neptunomonas phycophila]MDO6783012.1 hypothetical protein [Neptunomonas phycophila]MDP2521017.1 hypothetical protein [Neptunomonas phycophila]
MSQAVSTETQNRLQYSLLSLRLGVFIVMLMWTMDKFINPAHSAKVFEVFYGINSSTMVVYVIGAVQLLLILAFVSGIQKRITYGLIFLLHGASTLAAFGKYLDGFNNLLFFAAWPMWAACLALYLLRDEDVKFTVK